MDTRKTIERAHILFNCSSILFDCFLFYNVYYSLGWESHAPALWSALRSSLPWLFLWVTSHIPFRGKVDFPLTRGIRLHNKPVESYRRTTNHIFCFLDASLGGNLWFSKTFPHLNFRWTSLTKNGPRWAWCTEKRSARLELYPNFSRSSNRIWNTLLTME